MEDDEEDEEDEEEEEEDDEEEDEELDAMIKVSNGKWQGLHQKAS